jgi:hypothetical protein
VLCSLVTHYKSIAPVDQSDLEFFIPSNAKTKMDLDVHMSVTRKLLAREDSALNAADSSTVVNLLHSL